MTVSRSEFAHTIPIEVLGWLMRKSPPQTEQPWVLVVSPDPKGRLAANTVTRAPLAPCSVTFAVSYIAAGDRASLDAVSFQGVQPMIVATDALVPVVWEQWAPEFASHTPSPLLTTPSPGSVRQGDGGRTHFAH